MALMTIADMVYNSFDVDDVEARDIRNSAPFFMDLPATESSNGSLHKYTKTTTAPVVGFRLPNVGRAVSTTGRELVTVTLSILDVSTATDKAVADSDMRGPGYTISKEIREHIAAGMFAAEFQYINGTVGGDAAAFDGFADALATISTTPNDGTTGNVVMEPATPGTTVAEQTSIYLVREGEADTMGVMKGDEVGLGQTEVVPWTPTTNGTTFPAYYTPGTGWLGIQLGSIWSVARLCNIETAVTDADITALISTFPAARRPTRILMTPFVQGLLQASRTATTTTGAPAPLPLDVQTIPITLVDSITQTEAILI